MKINVNRGKLFENGSWDYSEIVKIITGEMSFMELIYAVETYRSREVSEMRIKNKKLGTTKAMTTMLATRHHAA